MQQLADLEHADQLGRLLGAGVQGPHAGVFFTDKQALVAVVGDAAFRLAGDLKAAHLFALYLALGIAAQAVLQEGAVLAIGEGVQLVAVRLEQADAVDFLERRADLAGLAQLTAGTADGEQAEAVVIAIAGHGQIDTLVAEGEVAAHIDVVQAPDRQLLEQLAVQIVTEQALFLVGAQHPRQARISGVQPDRRIIGGIAVAAHRLALAQRRDIGQQRRQGQRRRLPVQLAEVETPGGVVLQQQLQALGGTPRVQPLGLLQAVQHQVGHGLPGIALLLIEMQARRLRVQRQQAAGLAVHGADRALHATERRTQIDRLTRHIGLGLGRIGPQADAFFVDEQPIGGVVGLAILGAGWRRQAAQAQRRGIQPSAVTHQPLFALTVFTEQEQMQVAGLIAVQAQPGHRVVARRQRLRRAPLAAGRVERHQHRLLGGAVQAGNDQLLALGAAVQAGIAASQASQWLTVGGQQQQAFALAGGQAQVMPQAIQLGGQKAYILGLDLGRGAPGAELQARLAGRLVAAGEHGAGQQQSQWRVF